MTAIKGYATPEGTLSYKNRFQKKLHEDFFREKQGLWFSSIGAGSYLGEPDQATDALYEEALKEALLNGVNVIDSAVNYRAQRSERSFGKTLADLIGTGKIKREEVIVCTKGGFIPFDGEWPADAKAYIQETYINHGIVNENEIAQDCHAVAPAYLEDQLNKSLKNLGLETIDIYYLHNPETQLGDFDRGTFLKRMREAFRWCEQKVKEGKIRMYGAATWSGFRVNPKAPDYLSLEELNVLAREAGGGEHHFKAVQLPLNLAMPEAWIMANQSYGANLVPFLGIAPRYQMIVAASAALLQGRLTGPLPAFLDPYFEGLSKSAQKAIQFSRSVPGVTTSLVGMKKVQHVRENLEAAKVPVLGEHQLILMFQKAR